MKRKMVYLVGSGPGDPGLLTIRGKNLLKKADVVVYDRLINKGILEYASEKAELIYAGKESGRHFLSQSRINELLAQKVSEGKNVVRLKGGDPFLFGRGGEEALYLREKGLDFEVVPGVTSAVAVPAYAGIPVTHRDISSSFAVITGHEKPGKQDSSVRWEKISTGIDTLVFLMVLENLAYIVEKLLTNGTLPKTPVAIIRSGTLPEQEVLAGTLDKIVKKAEKMAFKPPALFIVGEVVALRKKLNCNEKGPLGGRRIVITRPKPQADSFADRVAELGGEAVLFPAIEIIKEQDLRRLYRAFKKILRFHWVVFSSINAVEIFFDEFFKQNMDARMLGGVKICAIGPKTEIKLRQKGLLPDLVPEQYCAEGILDVLKEKTKPGMEILLPRARGARAFLPDELNKLGLKVEEIYLYEAKGPVKTDDQIAEKIVNGNVDIITFTSSSSVKNFVGIIGKEHIRQVDSKTVTACIGPITSDAARNSGFTVDVEAKHYTIDGLIEAMVTYTESATRGYDCRN